MLDKLFKNFHHHWVLGTRAKRAVSGDNYQFTKYDVCHIVARLWPRQGALWTSPTSVIMAFRAVGVGQDGFDWELIKSTLYDDGADDGGADDAAADGATPLSRAARITQQSSSPLRTTFGNDEVTVSPVVVASPERDLHGKKIKKGTAPYWRLKFEAMQEQADFHKRDAAEARQAPISAAEAGFGEVPTDPAYKSRGRHESGRRRIFAGTGSHDASAALERKRHRDETDLSGKIKKSTSDAVNMRLWARCRLDAGCCCGEQPCTAAKLKRCAFCSKIGTMACRKGDCKKRAAEFDNVTSGVGDEDEEDIELDESMASSMASIDALSTGLVA
jgi:hypothetical protein